MTLSQSALSELLEAIRAGGGMSPSEPTTEDAAVSRHRVHGSHEIVPVPGSWTGL